MKEGGLWVGLRLIKLRINIELRINHEEGLKLSSEVMQQQCSNNVERQKDIKTELNHPVHLTLSNDS